MPKREQIAERLLLIVAPAATLAAADLSVKATQSIPPWYVHQRTNAWVAFNLADVCFLVGNLMLMASLMAVTIRNRDRLIPPRQWERALRQRLGR